MGCCGCWGESAEALPAAPRAAPPAEPHRPSTSPSAPGRLEQLEPAPRVVLHGNARIARPVGTWNVCAVADQVAWIVQTGYSSSMWTRAGVLYPRGRSFMKASNQVIAAADQLVRAHRTRAPLKCVTVRRRKSRVGTKSASNTAKSSALLRRMPCASAPALKPSRDSRRM